MASSSRIQSVDVARGAVMVLMAIDHVRVYSGIPAGGPTPGVFFTRWITNFVAPAFAFLAGTSAYLLGRRLGGPRPLARFLVSRGLVLVLLELTVIRVAWTFNLDFAHYLLAGVIWMLGWCMILLATLLWLPIPVIGGLGVAVILLHNLMDFVEPATRAALVGGTWGWLWQVLYFGGPIELGHGGPTLFVLYSLVPWVGVMAAGYAFGAVITLDAERRDRICTALGAIAVVMFLGLRAVDAYGDPRHWHAVATTKIPGILRFVNTTKYPASLQFLSMTLGPLLLLLPLADRARGKVSQLLATFGRVPMFYYVLHIPLIHLAAVAIALVRGSDTAWLFTNHPVMVPPVPAGYTWSLALLYIVLVVVIALLYIPCRWYARRKATAPAPWMRYI